MCAQNAATQRVTCLATEGAHHAQTLTTIATRVHRTCGARVRLENKEVLLHLIAHVDWVVVQARRRSHKPWMTCRLVGSSPSIARGSTRADVAAAGGGAGQPSAALESAVVQAPQAAAYLPYPSNNLDAAAAVEPANGKVGWMWKEC